MSSSSQHALFYAPETTYKQLPATPAFKPLSHTACTLALTKAVMESKEINGTRQMTSVRSGVRNAAGDISSELSFGSFDDLLEAVMCGTWEGDELRVGNIRRSFTMLRKFGDVADKPYQQYPGAEINSLSIDVKPDAVVGLSFNVFAADMALLAGAPSGSSFGSKSSSEVMDAFSGVISVNGVGESVVTELKLEISNGLAARYVVGSSTSMRPSLKKASLSANATLHFETARHLEMFLNDEYLSLSLTLKDPAGNAYTIDLPRAKYTAAQTDTSEEEDIFIPVTLAMTYDPAEQTAIKITRNAAA